MEKTREYTTLMKVFLIAFLAIWLNIQTIEAADGSVGYYYPAPNNVESYKARKRVHINTNRFARNNIIKMITNEFLSKPHPPRFVIFTKGTLSEKLIIVSMVKGYLDNCGNSGANTCLQTRLFGSVVFIRYKTSPFWVF